MIKTKKEYIIQRYLHAAFGQSEDEWKDIGIDRFVSKETYRLFKENTEDETIAFKALSEMRQSRPYEKFRAILRTTTIEEETHIEIYPKIEITPEILEGILNGDEIEEKRDLQNNPVLAHDGFRTFNGAIPAILKLNLNPFKMGAYKISVLEEALRQYKQGYFENKWFKLYDHQNNQYCDMINLGQKAMIIVHTDHFHEEKTFKFQRIQYDQNKEIRKIFDSFEKAQRNFISS